MERKQFLVLLLFVCEKVNQSRHKHHDNLRHYDKFDKEQAIEEALRSDRERQTVDVVQSHGWNGQRQSPWSPRQRPSARLPVLGQPQTQKGPAVSSQRGERGRIQTNPLRTAAPFLSQSNRPVEQIEYVQSGNKNYNFTSQSWLCTEQSIHMNLIKRLTKRGRFPSAAVQHAAAEYWAADPCWS